MLSLATGHAYFTKANHRLGEFWRNSAEIRAIAREESFLGRSLSLQIRVLSLQQGPLRDFQKKSSALEVLQNYSSPPY
jgi:hypothetical protein